MSTYYYNSVGLSSTITTLRTRLDEYSDIIEQLSTLKNSIDNSNEWVQENIKPSFIAKCNEYIAFYSIMIAKIEAYVNYLESKNKSMENLENSYS